MKQGNSSIVRFILIPTCLILLPYLLRTGYPLEFFVKWPEQDNKFVLYNAAIVYAPYFIFSYMYYKYFYFIFHNRRIKYKMDDFRKNILKIGNYKSAEKLIPQLIVKNNVKSIVRISICAVLIEFLITDFKHSCEELFGHSNIRVSIFLPDKTYTKMVRAFIPNPDERDS